MENISEIEERVLSIIDSWATKDISTIKPKHHNWTDVKNSTFSKERITDIDNLVNKEVGLEKFWSIQDFEPNIDTDTPTIPTHSNELCRCGCNIEKYLVSNVSNFGHFEDYEIGEIGCGEIFLSTGIYKWTDGTYHYMPEDKQLQFSDIVDTIYICENKISE